MAGSLSLGLVAALLFDLAVFVGAREHVITGWAMLAFAAGWAVLAVMSSRMTNQPQRWAFAPATYMAVVGAALLLFAPGNSTLNALGWVWPLALLALVVWMLRGARRDLHSRTRVWLLYPVFSVLALTALGGAFETVSSAVKTSPRPTGSQMVDVGGHRLYLRCVGSGSPTVVLENGLMERSPTWAWVSQAVARDTRVCAYDRAGTGWSDSASSPQDGVQVATDLHTLLARAHEPGPYVLAGHSTGGPYALTFAARYRSDMAGLVLLDSASPEQFSLPNYASFYSNWRRVSALIPTLARTGLARIVSRTGFGGLPAQARSEERAFASTAREWRGQRDEFSELPTAFKQAQALTDLAGVPLIVVTAVQGQQSGWTAAQNKLASLSTNSVHRTIPDASHASLLEDQADSANSSQAIRDVVEAVRTGTPLTR